VHDDLKVTRYTKQSISRMILHYDKDLYTIQDNEKIVGYTYFDVRKYKSIYSIYIYYMEIFEEYRGNKYGTDFIKYLFEEQSFGKTIMNIYGETSNRQVVLWLEHLGANFHSSQYRINSDLENNKTIGFGLNRFKFLKEIAKND